MIACVDTRQRNARTKKDPNGWTKKGRVKTKDEALALCANTEYMSLECPTTNGFEVFCMNNFATGTNELHALDCMGHRTTRVADLNGGNTAHCSGPFEWIDVWGGGWHTGAVYTVPKTIATTTSRRRLRAAYIGPPATPPGDAVAIDLCVGPVDVTRSGSPTNESPPGSYTETFTATDGKQESSCTRTVDVIPTPTSAPTHTPSNSPTQSPTQSPTSSPTTSKPTTSPTKAPTHHICAAESGINPCDSLHGVCDEVTSISLDGEYDVYYRGQQRRSATIQIKKSGSVATGYGMAGGEASKITQIADSEAECNGNAGYTIKIVKTHGNNKFECLTQTSSGDIRGLHFLGKSNSKSAWGAVVYKKRAVKSRRRLAEAPTKQPTKAPTKEPTNADPMAATGKKYIPTAHVGTFKCSCKASYECVASAAHTLDECYTCKMTAAPTAAPTVNPTKSPTAFPTKAPTSSPTASPTAPARPVCTLNGDSSIVVERCSAQADALVATSNPPDDGAHCTNQWDDDFPKPFVKMQTPMQEAVPDSSICTDGSMAEVLFIVDKSGSVGSRNYEKMKKWMKTIGSRLDLAATGTRVAALSFSGSSYSSRSYFYPKSEWKLSDNAASDHAAFSASVDAMRFTGGLTYTGKALDFADPAMWVGARDNVDRIMIVVTDGKSTDPAKLKVEAAKARKWKGVNGETLTIFALGVGNAKPDELDMIASNPIEYAHTVNNYAMLDSIANQIVDLICKKSGGFVGVAASAIDTKVRARSANGALASAPFPPSLAHLAPTLSASY